MKKITFSFFVFLSILILFSDFGLMAQNDTYIHVDQFGYYPTAEKVAVLNNPQVGFNAFENYNAPATLEVVEAGSNQVVFTGDVIVWNGGATDNVSGDAGWWFDFTAVQTSGTYFIRDNVNNIQSPTFEINNNPYEDVLNAATKMFYYNRCNMDKQQPYAGANWTDGNNFDNALQDYNCRFYYDSNNASLERDMSGGWFDAGDYNKYVTFAYTTVHDLLSAYEDHPNVFSDNSNIPESNNGVPDILDEIKWELDWMKKMTNEDGSTHIKMGNQNYSENVSSPPSLNTDQRFYDNTCTSASATVASTFAHAAKVYQDIPGYETYANSLLATAINTFEYVNTFVETSSLETDCDLGVIVAGDADMPYDKQIEVMVVAAVYLYELTGDESYNTFVQNYAFGTEPLITGFWSPYRLALIDALMLYTTFDNGSAFVQSSILNGFTTSIQNNWDDFYGWSDLTLYRDFMPTWSYHWGSNNVKAAYGSINLLAVKYGLNDDADNQFRKAKEMLHAFHGVNPFGMVYLSNMYAFGADKSINEMYHTWFYDQTDYDHALDSPLGPAPGFVVGGPNSSFSVTSLSPPANQPNAKSYLDFNTSNPDKSWEVSEPAIYYQASFVRLLASVINLSSTSREVSINVVLEGPYDENTGEMVTTLLDENILPFSQPYNVSPWNYNGNESVVVFPNNTVDWVLIEARSGTPSLTTPSTVIVETKAALLLNDGSVVDPIGGPLLFNNLTDDDYYFVVRHRNHLDVIGSSAATDVGGSLSFDFTTSTGQAFGSEQQKLAADGTAVMLGGDYSPNGIIQVTDYDQWIFNPASINVYGLTDGTLDAIIQATDYDQWFLNRSKIGAVEIQY